MFSRSQFDRRMLPIVCTLYVLSYLDRGNIGNAKTAGLQDELEISSSQWTWVLNSFYIAYVLFEWVRARHCRGRDPVNSSRLRETLS